jgi:hypothetical protein
LHKQVLIHLTHFKTRRRLVKGKRVALGEGWRTGARDVLARSTLDRSGALDVRSTVLA